MTSENMSRVCCKLIYNSEVWSLKDGNANNIHNISLSGNNIRNISLNSVRDAWRHKCVVSANNNKKVKYKSRFRYTDTWPACRLYMNRRCFLSISHMNSND
jgi:hypothetical protein